MRGGLMENEERARKIVESLILYGSGSITELMQITGVSKRTILRDLDYIEAEWHIALHRGRGKNGGGIRVSDKKSAQNFLKRRLSEKEESTLIKVIQHPEDKLTEKEREVVIGIVNKYGYTSQQEIKKLI